MKNHTRQSGFTLLELLIVIAIIAILSVALIIVINPAETLKKSRDAQRISDLSTLKTAIGIYTTSTTTPYLAGNANNTACKSGAGGGTYTTTTGYIYYSYPIDGTDITDITVDGATFSATFGPKQSTTAANSLTDSTGWLPVNFESLTSGSPISNLPVDPINTISSVTAVTNADLVYRYACNLTSLTYEIDAKLESTEYTTGANNKLTTDGGNNSSLYEVGTNLKILGTETGNDF